MSPVKQNTFPSWTKVRVLRESVGAIKRQAGYRYRKIVLRRFSYEVYIRIFHLHVQSFVNFDKPPHGRSV